MTQTQSTYLKAAHEVEVGDIVCEADGFMWTVLDRTFSRGKYTFTLSPRFQSMTARETSSVTIKRSASVRVSSESVESRVSAALTAYVRQGVK